MRSGVVPLLIRYLMHRFAALVALLVGISILVFAMVRLIPGDPAMAILGQASADPASIARLRQQLGLDQPVTTQYLTWLTAVLRGDFGYSYTQQRSVSSLVSANLPSTLFLTLAALLLTIVLGLALGVWAALKQGRAIDTVVMGAALTTMSLPSFWVGTMLLIIFAVGLGWFNVVGGAGLSGLVLPSLTLALGGVGFLARFVRSSVLDTSKQKFVTTARAKGLPWRRVVGSHIIRNALLPVLTVIGLQLGNLLSGTVIAETVFSRPGIGRLLIDAIQQKDYPTVQAVVLLIAAVYAIVNTLVDLLYPLLDPRVAAR